MGIGVETWNSTGIPKQSMAGFETHQYRVTALVPASTDASRFPRRGGI